jgi:hypothetical protein
MTTQAIQVSTRAISDRTQRMRDCVLVSSFGLWAVLLGVSPVLAFRALIGG